MKGFSQITLMNTQIYADCTILSALISEFFLRNLRETRRDKEKIKDKSRKIKDDKPDFLCPKPSAFTRQKIKVKR